MSEPDDCAAWADGAHARHVSTAANPASKPHRFGNLTAMPVADCLMTDHPEPREHGVSQDKDNEDPRRPTPSAARSAAIAAPPASIPTAPVSAVSAMSASITPSAAVHHDQIARVPGRRRVGGTDELAESRHGRMQTARARPV